MPEGILILTLNITERKRSEVALQRYARRMEVMHEIDNGIISATSVNMVVATAIKNLRQIIPVSALMSRSLMKKPMKRLFSWWALMATLL